MTVALSRGYRAVDFLIDRERGGGAYWGRPRDDANRLNGHQVVSCGFELRSDYPAASHSPAAQDVQVQVEHRLAGIRLQLNTVLNPPDAYPAPPRWSSQAHHRADEGVVLAKQIIQRRDVRARHDQHVHGRLRIDVFEGDETIVLVHLFAGISPLTIRQNRQLDIQALSINQPGRRAGDDHDPGNALEIGPDPLRVQAASRDNLRHHIGLARAHLEIISRRGQVLRRRRHQLPDHIQTFRRRRGRRRLEVANVSRKRRAIASATYGGLLTMRFAPRCSAGGIVLPTGELNH